MKIRITYTKVYDYAQLREEYEQAMQDYPLTFQDLQEFIEDRFISPNFDSKGDLEITIVREQKVWENN
jgi:hypothetical protein